MLAVFLEGLGCQASSATTEAEWVMDPSAVSSELSPDEDGWTDEELVKCFEHEARGIKASFQDQSSEQLATAIGVRWLKRVEKDGKDAKLRGRHLRALLRSKALDIYLSTLTRSQVGRKAISMAAMTDPARESIASAEYSPEIPLRILLEKASDASSVLMSSLLKLLSDISERAAGAVTKSSDLVSLNQDLSWVLLMLSASMIDASEVPVRMGLNTHKAIQRSLQELLDWWKAIVQPLGEGFVDKIGVSDAVWAEWPRNGRWFRAEVQEVKPDNFVVKWFERPTNVTGGQEDDYVQSCVGEGFNYENTTQVLKTAAIPAKYSRPQPIPEVEEEGWSGLLEAAEKLTAKFHELRSLFEDLGKDTSKELKKMREFEQKRSVEAVKTLEATAESIRALKKDFEKRSKTSNGSMPSFLLDALSMSCDVEKLVYTRLTSAHALAGSHDRLVGLRPNVAAACIEAEQLRGRHLEELLSGLHSAIYGEDVAFVLQDAASITNTKNIITSAMKLADQAWREAVQFAAETLDGPLAKGCEDISRAARRYKEFRSELRKVQERLSMLERNPPELPVNRKRQVYKKSSSVASFLAAVEAAEGYQEDEEQDVEAGPDAPADPPSPVKVPVAPDLPEVDFNSAAAAAAFEAAAPAEPEVAPPERVPAAQASSSACEPPEEEPSSDPPPPETKSKAQPLPPLPLPAVGEKVIAARRSEVGKAQSSEVGCLGRFATKCCGTAG